MLFNLKTKLLEMKIARKLYFNVNKDKFFFKYIATRVFHNNYFLMYTLRKQFYIN